MRNRGEERERGRDGGKDELRVLLRNGNELKAVYVLKDVNLE